MTVITASITDSNGVHECPKPYVATMAAIQRVPAARLPLPCASRSTRPLRRPLVTQACPNDPVVSTEWLAQHLEEVSVLDVRGHVDTVFTEPGVEKSTYLADYDAYLEGHIPVSELAAAAER